MRATPVNSTTATLGRLLICCFKSNNKKRKTGGTQAFFCVFRRGANCRSRESTMPHEETQKKLSQNIQHKSAPNTEVTCYPYYKKTTNTRNLSVRLLGGQRKTDLHARGRAATRGNKPADKTRWRYNPRGVKTNTRPSRSRAESMIL